MSHPATVDGRLAALSRRFAPLSGGLAAASAATRLSVAGMAAALVLPMGLGALPVVNNDFWNTTGYVAASPNEAASGAFDFTSFTTNEQPSDTLRRFSSDAPVGTFLYLR